MKKIQRKNLLYFRRVKENKVIIIKKIQRRNRADYTLEEWKEILNYKALYPSISASNNDWFYYIREYLTDDKNFCQGTLYYRIQKYLAKNKKDNKFN